MNKVTWKDYVFYLILLAIWIGGAFYILSHSKIQPNEESIPVESMTIITRQQAGIGSSTKIEEDDEVVIPMVAEPMHGRELYDFYVDQIHEQYYPNVPTSLVRAIIETESRYQPDVQNASGAVGLMQVIPKWHQYRAAKYHLNDLSDPYTNIIVGVDLLNELYEKYGNWSAALYGYNHSKSYVNHVLALAEEIEKGGGIDA